MQIAVNGIIVGSFSGLEIVNGGIFNGLIYSSIGLDTLNVKKSLFVSIDAISILSYFIIIL